MCPSEHVSPLWTKFRRACLKWSVSVFAAAAAALTHKVGASARCQLQPGDPLWRRAVRRYLMVVDKRRHSLCTCMIPH